jgi:hypothetical protein
MEPERLGVHHLVCGVVVDRESLLDLLEQLVVNHVVDRRGRGSLEHHVVVAGAASSAVDVLP